MTNAMLTGLRIIDLSMFVSGPFCTQILAELGADVIKVEPIGGDPVRAHGVGPKIGGEAGQFHTYNHGKRSIGVDLKQDAGRQIVLDLARHSDVLFDNFRPGVMGRLGLDHDALSAVNSKLVTVSLSGFGATGPWADKPGYDLIVQALSGALDLCGHRASGPAHIPYHIGDTAAGMYAAIAILAAVREADRTGRGRALEVSMLDAQLHLLGDEVTFAATGAWSSEPHGSGHPGLAPYAVFPTGDQPIVIAAVGHDRFWQNLTIALDMPELQDDPRFADHGLRVTNTVSLSDILSERLREKTAAAWLQIFAEKDVPAADISSVEDAIASPHARERGLVARVATRAGEEAVVPRIPIRGYGDNVIAALAPSPHFNGDVREVLRDVAGYSDDCITELQQNRVMAPD